MFEQLLAEPVLQLQRKSANTFVLAAQVRYLVLKNYAAASAAADVTSERALQLYMEAASMDTTDTVLWHSLGTLVWLHSGVVQCNYSQAISICSQAVACVGKRAWTLDRCKASI